MGLPESDAVRFASALDDYENVACATSEGRTGSTSGSWFVTSFSCQIASHCDYWDSVGAIIDHRQCLSLTPLAKVA